METNTMFENLTALVNEPRFYDIMSAIRGPDTSEPENIGGIQLKWLYTARIRSLIGINGVVGIATRSSKCVRLNDLKGAIREAELDGMSHYLHHVAEALGSLSFFLSDDSQKQEVMSLATLANMMNQYYYIVRDKETTPDVGLIKLKSILGFAQISKLVDEVQ